MIRSNSLPELRTFRKAETTLSLRLDPEFAPLVVPNGNASSAGHRWFKYKEAFSADLLARLLPKLAGDRAKTTAPLRLLDPYCGVGTALLSAQLLPTRVEPIGIECNPFSAFVARTKLAWPQMRDEQLASLRAEILATYEDHHATLPQLSSITSERCISRHMARQVSSARAAIESHAASPERDALLLGLAATIEPVSRVRRDGRALRIVKKDRVRFRDALGARWAQIAADLTTLRAKASDPVAAQVHLGDGRSPSAVGIADGSIDAIVTSPPYPNNIDYNEVYKLELWFLGFATDAASFLGLRRGTFRSHPTCSPLDTKAVAYDPAFLELCVSGPFADLMGKVIRRVAKLEAERPRGRTKVLLGYAHDTWIGLRSHFRSLRSGGAAAYVVGNSLHGAHDRPYLIPTDLILARLAQLVGFEVEEIIIARGLPRRLTGNHFLRDSVVVLRKP